MPLPVQIQFQNATFTANQADILVGNGSFELSGSQFLSMAGTFSFNALNIGSATISFYNSSAGEAVNGEITVPVAPGASGDPTITATGFSGSATISWPSDSGPQYQVLTSGESLALTGFATFSGFPD